MTIVKKEFLVRMLLYSFLIIISLSEVFLVSIVIQILKPLLVINKDNEDSVR